MCSSNTEATKQMDAISPGHHPMGHGPCGHAHVPGPPPPPPASAPAHPTPKGVYHLQGMENPMAPSTFPSHQSISGRARQQRLVLAAAKAHTAHRRLAAHATSQTL